jgi:hypothetical protein
MKVDTIIKTSHIAPCGMNCSICRGYLREKNKCLGCREIDENKPISRAKCTIKNCIELKNNNLKFCYKCKKFPCKRMKNLDKRYRTKYHMSMIENLENINKFGIRKFIENEKTRWKCSNCGSIICVHNGKCSNCDKKIF